MKIMAIGASGYLGSEVAYQARAQGHEVVGTYCTHRLPGLVKFSLDDKRTWRGVADQNPEVVVWAAHGNDADAPLTEFLHELPNAKFVYISSDIVLCARALAAKSALGEYARRKRDEQAAVLKNPAAAVFTVGPIFGINSAATIDKRTQPLLDEPQKERTYWSNVYKTFVPVKGLAKTVVANLDKRGQYFIGPPQRQSYYDFYVSRAQAHGVSTDTIRSTEISDTDLAALGQCADLSYTDCPNRLWDDM